MQLTQTYLLDITLLTSALQDVVNDNYEIRPKSHQNYSPSEVLLLILFLCLFLGKVLQLWCSHFLILLDPFSPTLLQYWSYLL